MFTSEEKAKLPRWAADKVALMEREIERLNDEIKADTVTEDTTIFWEPGARGIARGLPKHASVSFRIGRGKLNMFIGETGELRIYSDHSLNVSPRSCNSIYLTQE